jgi:hypothetical protein
MEALASTYCPATPPSCPQLSETVVGCGKYEVNATYVASGSAGSLRAGRRAAAIMSPVHSAKMNGHDPYAYLKDILERLPTQPASRIEELLPYRWMPRV